jgi:hypothetical protein
VLPDLGERDAGFAQALAPPHPALVTPAPPPPPPASPGAQEDNVVMLAAAEGGTTQIPIASSRGDIIPAGARKMSVRERLIPAPRAPKTASRTPSPEKAPGQTKKVLMSAFLVALSVATTLWRVEPVREFVFGSDVPSEEAVLAQFTPLAGYQYAAAPEGGQMMFDGIEKLMEEEYGVETTFDMKMVTQKGREVGSVVVVGGPPDVINAAETQAGYRDGLGAGIRLQPKVVAGTKVYFGTMPQARGATVAFFADPDGFFMTVGMLNRPAAEDVVKQLVRANV